MIGIIGAMEEEVAAIKEYMHIIDTKNILDCIFYQGMIENKEVVLLQGGVGKVNAAICTTLLLTNYQIDMVINIGSAGGLCLKQEVGDIVISNEVCQYDFDITAFPNRILGEVPGLPPRIKADEDLINKAKIFLEKLDLNYEIGLIVSGDKFVADNKTAEYIKNNFKDAKCCEMEAAAIGQTCYKFKTKFIIARSLSDIFGKGDSAVQFDEYLKKAAKASAKMCVALIKD
ncbi:5'-methylthioadenosine/adenosylhomocysteine nucleosidase [Thomasclavelia cocleata]|uniref:adenosylhomocysteine nucleosidase n=1 Tax=Thomasclavelia cocleata TaxID=69824 RepID=A0A1I0BCD5_9FIRM|nr:5'-methylthioadenosine/adenosylhomocysteine nucleosidase [Thomasclavelia cocleata]MCR1959958.1 5'-methylthioadenosine/adenosylhomocysteine nucleosidase [Thomasclavelia cocleata]NDO41699.1 5'-methylthioadenosine/adenosylhomocysteine nucleosidase [Thomasclavelia cocleata]PJN79733.1 5'-methylthioadenosine/adenosylhomocysteine nucleosidase [Thomasclavelia cocleata]SET03839.1 adenosylhomocysteine nucleosidase [Thomasclavelia cocleata]